MFVSIHINTCTNNMLPNNLNTILSLLQTKARNKLQYTKLQRIAKHHKAVPTVYSYCHYMTKILTLTYHKSLTLKLMPCCGK